MQEKEFKRKPKIGFISSDPASKTGFGTSLKAIMKYLYANYSDKYDFYVLSQGSGNGPEVTERWPWHTTSCFDCQIDQQRWASDPNYQRFVAYANLAVKDWVLKNSIDFIWAIEDCWAFDQSVYLNSNWFKKLEKNFVLWSTADSLPILDQFKLYAEKSEFWSWAHFAEKALKNEDPIKFANVQTLPGAIDPSEWKPISKQEKNELRAKFGLKPETKILIHLSRNQLRKFFWASLESMAIFKKRNPQHDCKLLIHSSWSEGWDLPKFIKEFGIDNNDVITTYFCRQCADWKISPFTGENQPCAKCGAKDSMITAGVNSTVTNSDLAKIYGMCDGSISCFSSGGLEFSSVNSLFCEVPLACTDYSCGEDFTCHDFVHSIGGTEYREIGTNFRKHTPNINDLVKFWKKICELTPEKKEKIVKPAREWALEYFNVERICKKLVERIDKYKLVDWSDYKGEGGRIEQYQPNFPIDTNLEGGELVNSLYKNVLGMEISHEDPGFLDWSRQLAAGAPKDQVISYFRSVASQEIQKLSGPKSFQDIFSEEDREKLILIGLPKSYGDCIWLSSLLKGMQENYPDKNIAITCEPQYFGVFEGNPYVKRLIPWNPAFENIFLLEGIGENRNLVFMYYPIYSSTQRFIDYTHRSLPQVNTLEMEYK